MPDKRNISFVEQSRDVYGRTAESERELKERDRGSAARTEAMVHYLYVRAPTTQFCINHN